MSESPRYGAGLTNDTLWYDRPAARFLDALPIGNGRLAAMVFGGTRLERLALNHEWLWRGRNRMRDAADSAARLPEVRHDLPTGAKRVVQLADGFDATICGGEVTFRSGVATGALPGVLLRGARH